MATRNSARKPVESLVVEIPLFTTVFFKKPSQVVIAGFLKQHPQKREKYVFLCFYWIVAYHPCMV